MVSREMEAPENQRVFFMKTTSGKAQVTTLNAANYQGTQG